MNANELKYDGYLGRGDAGIARASIAPDATMREQADSYLVELDRLCRLGDINFRILFGQAMHETDKFRSTLWAARLNPAGIKDSDGNFKRYRNGVDAARAHVVHTLLYLAPGISAESLTRECKNYQYLEGRASAVRKSGFADSAETLADIAKDGKGWAEDVDYTARVARMVTAIFKTSRELPVSVLLVSGHRNTSGGHPEETARTPALASAYIEALKTAGIWREHLQAIDDDGDPDDTLGSLALVANLSREWIERQRLGARVPIMLDLHFESGGSGGVFAIVSDAPGDSWESNTWDVLLARNIVSGIHESTGLAIRAAGVREPGVMSEQQTGVGSQGYRLGMFALTAGTRAYALRLVVEHGAIDRDPDRAIIRSGQFSDRAASGAVAGIVRFAEAHRVALEALGLR